MITSADCVIQDFESVRNRISENVKKLNFNSEEKVETRVLISTINDLAIDMIIVKESLECQGLVIFEASPFEKVTIHHYSFHLIGKKEDFTFLLDVLSPPFSSDEVWSEVRFYSSEEQRKAFLESKRNKVTNFTFNGCMLY